ncbi:MAG TPA: DUF2934 domain-containing protein [Oculatellaceae cyanobacterium]
MSTVDSLPKRSRKKSATTTSTKELATPKADKATIEVAAYFLWLQDGQRHGNDRYYWHQAKRQLGF